MKPIGLSYKSSGELMIVHMCLYCGKISCNRIAGDDVPHIVVGLLEEPDIANDFDVKLLSHEDKEEVMTVMYGRKNGPNANLGVIHSRPDNC